MVRLVIIYFGRHLKKCTVISIDLWAFGESTLVEDINPPSVTIVGHSLGGHIGFLLAEQLNHYCKQLILLDSPIWDPSMAFNSGPTGRSFICIGLYYSSFDDK